MTMLRNRTYKKVAVLNVTADQTLFTIHISVLRASLFQTQLGFILQLWDGKGSIQSWSTTHFKEVSEFELRHIVFVPTKM